MKIDICSVYCPLKVGKFNFGKLFLPRKDQLQLYKAGSCVYIVQNVF